MRSRLVALLFSDLGIDASHSRPRMSHDNPFSEAQFRTLKYRPAIPDRFGSLAHARAVSRDLFAWYNDAHHHSGLTYLTPAAVHYGRAATVLAVRHRTRLAAYAAHPEPFVKGPPRPETLLTAVWINRPPTPTRQDAPGATIVTTAWGDPPVSTHQWRSLDHVRHHRGGATVNAESGCLKCVDTARGCADGSLVFRSSPCTRAAPLTPPRPITPTSPDVCAIDMAFTVKPAARLSVGKYVEAAGFTSCCGPRVGSLHRGS